MKIELKNIKISLAHSEETILFNANVYVDGKKVGYAKNDGRGGSTDIYPNEPKFGSVLNQADAFCKTMQPINSINMNLENYVDHLIDLEIGKKEQKKIESNYNKGICYGNPSKYQIVSWSLPIAKMIVHPVGMKLVRNKITELLAGGHTIMNNNIPQEFYQQE